MNKYLLGVAGGLMAIVTMTSCSSEEPNPMLSLETPSDIPSVETSGELQTVTFGGTIPQGVHARGLADYSSDQYHLTVAIYDLQGNLVLSEEYQKVDASQSFSVKFNLAKDGQYRAVFIAETEYNTIWKTDLDAKTVSVSAANNSVQWRKTEDIPLFIWDDPVVIKPAEQSSYSVVLKRPTSEIILLSNQMNEPAVANIFKSGINVAFGKRTEIYGYRMSYMYKSYNFWTGKAEDEKVDVAVSSSLWSTVTMPGYEGYTVLCRGQFFVDRETGSNYNLAFGLTPSDNSADPIPYSLGEINCKPNTRYYVVDNGSNGGGGDEPGGGLFYNVTTFSMNIDEVGTDNSIIL